MGVEGLAPGAWRKIEGLLAQWEADGNRERTGRPKDGSTVVSDTDDKPRDQESARGIHRRLVKWAQAGDVQAAGLVEQRKSCRSVNQAAIAAGPRQEYIRVRMDDPAKAAASLRWGLALVTVLPGVELQQIGRQVAHEAAFLNRPALKGIHG